MVTIPIPICLNLYWFYLILRKARSVLEFLLAFSIAAKRVAETAAAVPAAAVPAVATLGLQYVTKLIEI